MTHSELKRRIWEITAPLEADEPETAFCQVKNCGEPAIMGADGMPSYFCAGHFIGLTPLQRMNVIYYVEHADDFNE
jgi:hypothetical protein